MLKDTTSSEGQCTASQNQDFLEAEILHLKRLSECERVFGAMSGETGLALMALEGFYRKNDASEKAVKVEQNIEAILKDYLLNS